MIQDIKDRVPVNVLSNDAIRYGIYDENGALLRYEYIKREDEPIEIGTPVNRALFSNIQGDLYTQDRYNQPQVAHEPTRYGLVQRDIIPKVWTEISSTEFIAGDGTILTSSGSSDTSVPASRACDGDSTSNWVASAIYNPWIKLKFTNPIKITKMKTMIRDNYGNNKIFISAIIQGSNDDNIWDDLYTISDEQTNLTEITLNNPSEYQYYRIYITMSSTSWNAQVLEWQVSEYEGYEYNYVNNLSLPLKSYEVGKIVNIEGISYEGITSFENPYININNLGAKQINGTIVAGEKYNLIYNGESWDIAKPNKQKIVDYTFTEDTEQIIFDNLNVPAHETISIKIIGATSGSEPAGLQINDITSNYIDSSESDLTKCPLPMGFSNNHGAILKANIMRNYNGFPFVICENVSATTRQTYYRTSSIIATHIVGDINKLIFFASASDASAKFEAGTKIEIWKEW